MPNDFQSDPVPERSSDDGLLHATSPAQTAPPDRRLITVTLFRADLRQACESLIDRAEALQRRRMQDPTLERAAAREALECLRVAELLDGQITERMQ